MVVLFSTNPLFSKFIEVQNGVDSLEVRVNLRRTFRSFIYLEYEHSSFIQYSSASQPLFHKYEPVFGFLCNDILVGYKHVSGGTGTFNDSMIKENVIREGYDLDIDFIIVRVGDFSGYVPIRNTYRNVYSSTIENEVVGSMRIDKKYYNILEYKQYINHNKLKFEYKLGINQLPEINFRLRLYYDGLFYIGYMNERTHYLHDYKNKVENLNLGIRVEF